MQTVKIEVAVPKKAPFFTVFGEIGKRKLFFFRSWDFIFIFFAFFSKLRQSISTLPVIWSFICTEYTYSLFVYAYSWYSLHILKDYAYLNMASTFTTQFSGGLKNNLDKSFQHKMFEADYLFLCKNAALSACRTQNLQKCPVRYTPIYLSIYLI